VGATFVFPLPPRQEWRLVLRALADASSYALAKSLGAALLFVGNDFAATDVGSALALQ